MAGVDKKGRKEKAALVSKAAFFMSQLRFRFFPACALVRAFGEARNGARQGFPR